MFSELFNLYISNDNKTMTFGSFSIRINLIHSFLNISKPVRWVLFIPTSVTIQLKLRGTESLAEVLTSLPSWGFLGTKKEESQ